MQHLSVALVGLGGFGINYVNALLSEADRRNVRFVAGIDPAPEGCCALAEIQKQRIPIYPTLQAYFASGGRADLIALATPLQLHCQQVVEALEAGSHVICEKPLGVSPEQVCAMIQARDKAGKTVAIGYQWSYARATQQLKRDILAGRFGAPRRFASVACWPRDDRYYGRNNWAGRICDDAGRLVLDSPANNACAHHLHHMFYLLGSSQETSAMPASVTAELYRANPIQNYDTAAIRCTTTAGAELLFLASHVTQNSRGPACRFELEKATILYGQGSDDHLHVHFPDGRVEDYGGLPGAECMDKLWAVIEAIRGGGPVLCGIEAASAQTLSICAAQQSVAEISGFPQEIVRREKTEGGHRFVVDGLEETLQRCCREFKMPAELGVPWARAGTPIVPETLSRAMAQFDPASTVA